MQIAQIDVFALRFAQPLLETKTVLLQSEIARTELLQGKIFDGVGGYVCGEVVCRGCGGSGHIVLIFGVEACAEELDLDVDGVAELFGVFEGDAVRVLG